MRAATLLIVPTLLAAACSPAPQADTAGLAPTGADRAAEAAAASAEAAAADPQSAPPRPPTPAPEASDSRACEARGGRMQRVGMAQAWACVTPYSDAGKRCTDGDQCQGDCILTDDKAPGAADQPVTGQCQADDNRFGCTFTVEDGRRGPGLCID